MIRAVNIVALSLALFGLIPLTVDANTRTVDLTYRADMTEIPDTAERIALWLPLPANHENQTVTNLRFSASHD